MPKRKQSPATKLAKIVQGKALKPLEPTEKLFESCLKDSLNESNTNDLLRRAMSIQVLGDTTWLSSTFTDLVFAKFAEVYSNIHFMSSDFIAMALSTDSKLEMENFTDIIGNKIDYKDPKKTIIFLYNSHNIHWNLFRVVREPEPVLALLEPMGHPNNKQRSGLGHRDVPHNIIRWLNMCCPLKDQKSWLECSTSIIETQQQFTGYDCGVACLFYTELYGQNYSNDLITKTSQSDISEYRILLQEFLSQTV